jgi:hypothetical protein
LKRLIGLKILHINACYIGSEMMSIETDEGKIIFQHIVDCCEEVSIEDIYGDPQDLIGKTVLEAEERTY